MKYDLLCLSTRTQTPTLSRRHGWTATWGLRLNGDKHPREGVQNLRYHLTRGKCAAPVTTCQRPPENLSVPPGRDREAGKKTCSIQKEQGSVLCFLFFFSLLPQPPGNSSVAQRPGTHLEHGRRGPPSVSKRALGHEYWEVWLLSVHFSKLRRCPLGPQCPHHTDLLITHPRPARLPPLPTLAGAGSQGPCRLH